MISAVEKRRENVNEMMLIKKKKGRKAQTLVSFEEGKTKCVKERNSFKEEHIPNSFDDWTWEMSAAIECGEPR